MDVAFSIHGLRIVSPWIYWVESMDSVQSLASE